MRRKYNCLVVCFLIAVFAFSWGIICAPLKARSLTDAVSSVEVSDVSVERLNKISKDKFQKTDVLVFRTTFTFSNPNPSLAEISDFYFEVKVDDGTADKTIVQSGAMPVTYVPGGGEITWFYADALAYGGMIGSYILRGLGEGGIKGAVAELNKVWKALGGDEKVFYITGRFATSLPDNPALGKKFQKFDSKFAVPAL